MPSPNTIFQDGKTNAWVVWETLRTIGRAAYSSEVVAALKLTTQVEAICVRNCLRHLSEHGHAIKIAAGHGGSKEICLFDVNLKRPPKESLPQFGKHTKHALAESRLRKKAVEKACDDRDRKVLEALSKSNATKPVIAKRTAMQVKDITTSTDRLQKRGFAEKSDMWVRGTNAWWHITEEGRYWLHHGDAKKGTMDATELTKVWSTPPLPTGTARRAGYNELGRLIG